MNQNEFNLTGKQLAEAQGINEVTVNAWAKEGAFPFMRTNTRKSERVFRLFHQSAATLSLGEIKSNRATRKFVDPVLYAEDFQTAPKENKKRAKQFKLVHERLENMDCKLDLICEKLGIEI